MSVMIQIRNVPSELHRRLKSRAALTGISMSDYILRELRRSLDRPGSFAQATGNKRLSRLGASAGGGFSACFRPANRPKHVRRDRSEVKRGYSLDWAGRGGGRDAVDSNQVQQALGRPVICRRGHRPRGFTHFGGFPIPRGWRRSGPSLWPL